MEFDSEIVFKFSHKRGGVKTSDCDIWGVLNFIIVSLT